MNELDIFKQEIIKAMQKSTKENFMLIYETEEGKTDIITPLSKESVMGSLMWIFDRLNQNKVTTKTIE